MRISLYQEPVCIYRMAPKHLIATGWIDASENMIEGRRFVKGRFEILWDEETGLYWIRENGETVYHGEIRTTVFCELLMVNLGVPGARQ